MARHVRKVSSLCRFCLNEDEEQLVPISIITDVTFTIRDIEHFSGVWGLEDENETYMICSNCDKILRKSIAFRDACIKNDAYFKDISVEYVESTGDGYDETNYIVYELNECSSVLSDSAEDTSQPRKSKILSINIEEHDAFNFTANHIELGEPFSTDDERSELQEWKAMKTKPKQNRRTRTATDSVDDTLAERAAGNESDCKLSSELAEKSRKLSDVQLCDICGKQVCRLRSHMKFHTQRSMHSCPHCPVKMNDLGNLHRHVQAVHFKKVIRSCEVCGKGFTCKDSHLVHLRAQHGIGDTLDCKICSRKFNTRGGLREHFIRSHTDERKFECSTCGSMWKTRQSLRHHERVHSSEQPFACRLCPKRFKSPYAKRTHELTHSGILFQCELCEKSYRYKTLLNIHIRKFHPEIKNAHLAD